MAGFRIIQQNLNDSMNVLNIGNKWLNRKPGSMIQRVQVEALFAPLMCLVVIGTLSLTCGLLYFPSLSIVAQWFESRRALAVGLAICGSGVGTCLIAVFFPGAVQTFSWRGLLIIFGAVFFQLAVVIALFRPLEVQQLINLEKSKKRAKERRLRLERERIAAVVRREKLRQVAAGQMPNQRRGTNSRVGGIMSRIIEEKFRQRSTSTGSLDGMVITRDNELISLRTGADYELVRQAAVAAVRVEGQAGSHGRIGQFSSASVPSPMRHFSASDRFVNLPPKNSNQLPTNLIPIDPIFPAWCRYRVSKRPLGHAGGRFGRPVAVAFFMSYLSALFTPILFERTLLKEMPISGAWTVSVRQKDLAVLNISLIEA
ncbi:hypothetical protein ACTXT7_000803 [Hymenolepis weldensis]